MLWHPRGQFLPMLPGYLFQEPFLTPLPVLVERIHFYTVLWLFMSALCFPSN